MLASCCYGLTRLSVVRHVRHGPAQEVGAGIVVGDQVFEGEDEAGQIATGANVPERFETEVHASCRKAIAGEDLDLFVVGGHDIFTAEVELFIKFLAWPDPGELDLDFMIGA